MKKGFCVHLFDKSLVALPANLSFEAGTYGQVLQPCPLPFN